MIFNKLLGKIFGTRNQRVVKQFMKVVAQINALEPQTQVLSDEALREKTNEFKQRVAGGESLDSILPEAFAVVREASSRTLGMRHFDVQLVGGMVLHQGKVAEMRTGEGKTLVATLAVYLNALSSNGVHVVTVNDYLANRDANWMRPVYEFLGLTLGINLPSLSPEEKRSAYAADITYGTNNEFGFDYLRDNMAFRLEDKVQRTCHYAVIDEVDSILIDEARTPLIISGVAEDSANMYRTINQLVPKLRKSETEEGDGDYHVDEKTKQVHFSEAGHEHLEALLAEVGLLKENSGLYDYTNLGLMHHVSAAVRAHSAFTRDVDYIVRDNKVHIVDEHTGRVMIGRRWSDGLHQAVEAKEGVEIQKESQTLASITFQNYFRIYDKLSGMTGTADTEAFELNKIYGLEVVVIPTNKPMVRNDKADQIYLNAESKYRAIVKSIREAHERGQPVLVGTASIESSEFVSQLLKKEKIKHEVLNAKQHEREAGIIAEAGRPGSVTIATNMAGRGTDIVLGGNLEVELEALDHPSDTEIEKHKNEWKERHAKVLEAGGLHVLGTERHESRRIDNQLRGRAGRQGDVGSSQFYLALDDNLMRIFASDRVAMLMQKFGMKEDEAIEHPWVNKAIENAQRKVEGHNFDMRKQLLEFDDVTNDQRKVIYQQRSELLATENIAEVIDDIIEGVVTSAIDEYIPPQSMEEMWNVEGLTAQLKQTFAVDLPLADWLAEDKGMDETALRDRIVESVDKHVAQKRADAPSEVQYQVEKTIMLHSLDNLWREHIGALDHLRRGISLRSYAQKDPKQEYKREAFNMFTDMLIHLKHDVVSTLCLMQLQLDSPDSSVPSLEQPTKMQYIHKSSPNEEEVPEKKNGAADTFKRDTPKVGRNHPCPCGSGKKFKQCHGVIK